MKKNKKTSQDFCDINLHAKSVEEYGDKYQEHFLEQYKIMIQGIDYSSKWKYTVNSYFLTINTFLIAAVGISISRDQLVAVELAHKVIPIIGIFVAIVWMFISQGYNDVLRAKFAILHCIEKKLPLALYKTEWEIIKSSYSNPMRARLTESLVPLIFLVFFVIIFFFLTLNYGTR